MSDVFTNFQRHASDAREILRDIHQRREASKRADQDQVEGSRKIIDSSRELLRRTDDIMADRSTRRPD